MSHPSPPHSTHSTSSTTSSPPTPSSSQRIKPPPIVTHDALPSATPIQKTIANLKRQQLDYSPSSHKHKPSVSSNLHYSVLPSDQASIDESVNQLIPHDVQVHDPLADIPCSPDEARKALRLPPSRAHSRSVSADMSHHVSLPQVELSPQLLVEKLALDPVAEAPPRQKAHSFVASPMAMGPVSVLQSPTATPPLSEDPTVQQRQDEGNGFSLDPCDFLCAPKDPMQPLLETERKPPIDVIKCYRLLRHLGDGAFATVWLARNEDVPLDHKAAHVAIKLTLSHKDAQGNEVDLVRARHEVEVARRLQGHEGIVKLLDIVETPEYMAMVMEWVRYGTLYTWCTQRAKKSDEWQAHDKERWSALAHHWERDAQHLFVSILQAVLFTHQRGFVHRDLKLENILLDVVDHRICPKICDFGLAAPILRHPAWNGGQPPQSLTRLDLSQGAGSDEYLPPEFVLLTASHNVPATSKTDVWSLGIILYAMLYGRMPFLRKPGQTRRSFLYKIATADIKIKRESDASNTIIISNAARQVLSAMLKRRAAERIDGHEVVELLWVKEGLSKVNAL